MTDVEMAVVCFVNECQQSYSYRYKEYQMLHGVKYRKEMQKEALEMIRSNYRNRCLDAAYELKTYYMENRLPSNTIVLKMRPETPERKEMPEIRIHSELDGTDKSYTHHAIEIFKEDGKYKVFDILHRDKAVWLESYLDEVCRTNDCPRTQLRYDFGYLVPCHAYSGNMQELVDLMRYLDKTYKIGKPRLNFENIPGAGQEAMLLSDDVIMDFDLFGREIGVSGMEVIEACLRVYDRLMKIQFNILIILCMEYYMGEWAAIARTREHLFDSAWICTMLEMRLDVDEPY